MNSRNISYMNKWRELKNEAVIEEELDEDVVDFDDSNEGNDFEFD